MSAYDRIDIGLERLFGMMVAAVVLLLPFLLMMLGVGAAVCCRLSCPPLRWALWSSG